jgi:hypothetical protein
MTTTRFALWPEKPSRFRLLSLLCYISDMRQVTAADLLKEESIDGKSGGEESPSLQP